MESRSSVSKALYTFAYRSPGKAYGHDRNEKRNDTSSIDSSTSDRWYLMSSATSIEFLRSSNSAAAVSPRVAKRTSPRDKDCGARFNNATGDGLPSFNKRRPVTVVHRVDTEYTLLLIRQSPKMSLRALAHPPIKAGRSCPLILSPSFAATSQAGTQPACSQDLPCLRLGLFGFETDDMSRTYLVLT